MSSTGAGYSPRPTYSGTSSVVVPPTSQPSATSYSSQQEYYRSEQVTIFNVIFTSQICTYTYIRLKLPGILQLLD